MTLRKRWRIVRAIFTQQWTEKTCAECGATWLHQGRPMPHLIAICDQCEDENLERFAAAMEREYQQQRSRS